MSEVLLKDTNLGVDDELVPSYPKGLPTHLCQLIMVELS